MFMFFKIYIKNGYRIFFFLFFFFNDTATTEIYTLSLHDALPIYRVRRVIGAQGRDDDRVAPRDRRQHGNEPRVDQRSEEHTSELQSHLNLVCRLLLEKKKRYSFPYLSPPLGKKTFRDLGLCSTYI